MELISGDVESSAWLCPQTLEALDRWLRISRLSIIFLHEKANVGRIDWGMTCILVLCRA
jgi:hypothetical protein